MAPDPTEVIDNEGDVTLIVGSEHKKRMRVSSHMLKKGSSVFKAMFSGRFAEGLNLSATNPKDVELPEDDPDDVEILCNILHFRLAPTDLPKDRIQSFAMLVDKYDCSTAVRAPSYLWIFQIDTTEFRTLLQMISAAFLLGDPVSFRILTKRIVSHHAFGLELIIDTPVLPVQVFISLAQQRGKALSIFYAGLGKFANQKCNKASNCDYHTAQLAEFRRVVTTEAMKHSFSGFAAMSVTDLSNFLGSLKEKDWRYNNNGCRSTSIDMSPAKLHTLAQEILDSCHGLCLQCVKDNNNFPRKCLAHHSK